MKFQAKHTVIMQASAPIGVIAPGCEKKQERHDSASGFVACPASTVVAPGQVLNYCDGYLQ